MIPALTAEAAVPGDHYTVEDWLALPEIVGQRVELIDGSLVVSAPPLSTHQLCAGRLARILNDAAPTDLEVIGAFGVRTANEVAVPDVVAGDADVITGGVPVLLPEQTHSWPRSSARLAAGWTTTTSRGSTPRPGSAHSFASS